MNYSTQAVILQRPPRQFQILSFPACQTTQVWKTYIFLKDSLDLKGRELCKSFVLVEKQIDGGLVINRGPSQDLQQAMASYSIGIHLSLSPFECQPISMLPITKHCSLLGLTLLLPLHENRYLRCSPGNRILEKWIQFILCFIKWGI